jgi:hypothetical protein
MTSVSALRLATPVITLFALVKWAMINIVNTLVSWVLQISVGTLNLNNLMMGLFALKFDRLNSSVDTLQTRFDVSNVFKRNPNAASSGVSTAMCSTVWLKIFLKWDTGPWPRRRRLVGLTMCVLFVIGRHDNPQRKSACSQISVFFFFWTYLR